MRNWLMRNMLRRNRLNRLNSLSGREQVRDLLRDGKLMLLSHGSTSRQKQGRHHRERDVQRGVSHNRAAQARRPWNHPLRHLAPRQHQLAALERRCQHRQRKINSFRATVGQQNLFDGLRPLLNEGSPRHRQRLHRLMDCGRHRGQSDLPRGRCGVSAGCGSSRLRMGFFRSLRCIGRHPMPGTGRWRLGHGRWFLNRGRLGLERERFGEGFFFLFTVKPGC